MTIGIAITLPGAVLLVSDSRQTKVFAPDVPPNDNVEKIKIIGDHFGVIKFGITHVTELAIANLITKFPAVKGCFIELLEKSISFGWNNFTSAISSDVDCSNPIVRAALVSGGFDADGPFIAGVMRDFKTPNPPIIRRDIFNFIVLGGEDYDAMAVFEGHVTESINRVGRNALDSLSPIGKYILEDAHSTIRFVSQKDDSVGGNTRYAFITAFSPPLQGTIESGQELIETG